MIQLANNALRQALKGLMAAWAILWVLLPMVASAAPSPLVLSDTTPQTEV